SADRTPFIVRNDREQILHAHDFRAGNVLDRRLINGDELSADGYRPDEASVEHVGHGKVMHVDVRAKAFCRYVRPRQRLADDGIARGVLEGRLGIELEVELAASNEVCE